MALSLDHKIAASGVTASEAEHYMRATKKSMDELEPGQQTPRDRYKDALSRMREQDRKSYIHDPKF